MLNKLRATIEETDTKGEKFKYRKLNKNRIEVIFWDWVSSNYISAFSEVLTVEEFTEAVAIIKDYGIERDILNLSLAESKKRDAYKWINESASCEELIIMQECIKDRLSKIN